MTVPMLRVGTVGVLEDGAVFNVSSRADDDRGDRWVLEVLRVILGVDKEKMRACRTHAELRALVSRTTVEIHDETELLDVSRTDLYETPAAMAVALSERVRKNHERRTRRKKK